MRFMKVIALVIVLALGATLAGCGDDSGTETTEPSETTATTEPVETTTTSEASETTTTTEPVETTTTTEWIPQRVVVQSGAPGPNITDLPVYVAEEAGFFEQEGLNVTLQYGEGGSLAAQLASSGRVDFSTNTYEPVIPGYAEGIRGKVFFEVNAQVTYYIAVLASSEAETLADLEGATIGAMSLGSTAIPSTKVQFTRAGVDPATITYVPVGTAAAAALALESGEVDGLAMWTGAFAVIEGAGTELKAIRDPEMLEFGNGGTWVRDELIEQNPELVARYARALAKALVLIRDYPEVAVLMYFAESPEAEESMGFDSTLEQILYVSQDFTSTSPLGQMDLEKANAFIEMYAAELGVADPPTAEDIMTNQFIEAANDFDVQVVIDAAEAYQAEHGQ